jgi:glucose repression regulatory protein TUP1
MYHDFKIWEIKRKRVRTAFKGRFERIDFSPDGRFLVSASSNDGIRMWRIRDGSSTSLSQPNGDFVLFRPVVFSPDGRCVVAGSTEDGRLEIRKARTGRLLKEWQAHPDSLTSLAYQPDGKRLASASASEGIWKSWNVSSLQGQLHSSEPMVNDGVEKEVLECEGHGVRSLLVPSCYTFS